MHEAPIERYVLNARARARRFTLPRFSREDIDLHRTNLDLFVLVFLFVFFCCVYRCTAFEMENIKTMLEQRQKYYVGNINTIRK